MIRRIRSQRTIHQCMNSFLFRLDKCIFKRHGIQINQQFILTLFQIRNKSTFICFKIRIPLKENFTIQIVILFSTFTGKHGSHTTSFLFQRNVKAFSRFNIYRNYNPTILQRSITRLKIICQSNQG